MSSSTFEVKEPENESEKLLDLGLDAACEENGLELTAQVDGEAPRDHTYNKEPDVEEKEEENNSEKEEEVVDNMEEASSPKKKGGKTAKAKKAEKPVGRGRPKKEVTKKETPVKKGKKKENEESEPVSESTTNGEEPEAKVESPALEEKETPKVSKRGRKRKIEEKENVIDQSIVEEVQNITEDPALNETTEETPAKKAKTKAPKEEKTPKPKKTAKSKVTSGDGIEDCTNLPKGWVRQEVVRKSGKSAGMIDVYIYSPDGTKFRSKPDVAKYLVKNKSSLNIDSFDFSKKKSTTSTKISSKTPVKTKPKPVKTNKVEKKTTKIEKKTTKTEKKKPKSPKIVKKIAAAVTKKKAGKVTKKEQSVKKVSKTPVKVNKAKSAKTKGNKKKKSA